MNPKLQEKILHVKGFFRTFRIDIFRQENMFHVFLLIFKKFLSNPLKPDSFISMGKKYFGGFKQAFETNVCQEYFKGYLQ
jgi:hypothetical protein